MINIYLKNRRLSYLDLMIITSLAVRCDIYKQINAHYSTVIIQECTISV